MSTFRLSSVPSDYVVGEMVAFPLASEPAFRMNVSELRRDLASETGDLWRAAERQLLALPGFGVDEVVGIRDRVWFHYNPEREDAPQRVSMRRYLKAVAIRVLEVHGNVGTPALWHSARQDHRVDRGVLARARWRWLSLALPPDLYLAALHPKGPEVARIRSNSPTLYRQLESRGFAEPHLHLGAAFDFRSIWAATLRSVADPDFRCDTMESAGADFDDARDFPYWLVAAAIVRYLLARFLATARTSDDFHTFLEREVLRNPAEAGGATSTAILRQVLLDVTVGRSDRERLPSWLGVCQALYRRLTRVTLRRPPRKLEAVQGLDPASLFFPVASEDGATPELTLMRSGFAYLKNHQDRRFERLFWQAVRVRSLFYRYLVQRPMTPGLQWFTRFYSRAKPFRAPLNRVAVQSAARLGGRGEGLRSLELRISPSQTATSLYRNIQEIGRNDLGEIELGIVCHFARKRGGGASRGRPVPHGHQSHADPRRQRRRLARPAHLINASGYRFAGHYKEMRNAAVALAHVLTGYPLALQLVRGLDACSDELGVPTWVLSPLFRYVRRAGEVASRALETKMGIQVEPLRSTVHAGEDFVHLQTGLRLVYESLTRLDLREGDRLGHGLALGTDPWTWAKGAGRLPMAREDRLLDLVWEWAFYGAERLDVPESRRYFLDREIAELSTAIFGRSYPPLELLRLVDDLHEEGELQSVGFPNGVLRRSSRDEGSRRALLLLYLTDAMVFERGREVLWVDPVDDGALLEQLQMALRSRIGQMGVTIEVNPTSNLLIADFGDLSKHPLWRLLPPRPTGEMSQIAVCIGSDDPLTFATNLRLEYQFVQDALIMAGLSDLEARDWTDGVRRHGLDTRFTVRRVSTLPLRSYPERRPWLPGPP